MDRTFLHGEIRNALSVADELSRHEHHLGRDELAGTLAALRSALADLERVVGRSHVGDLDLTPKVVDAVERSIEALLVRRSDVPRSLRKRTEALVASAERVSLALWDPGERLPSKPVVFGRLPLARVVPADVHAVLDYANAAGMAASALVARTTRARAVSAALSLGLAAATATTDHRLGAVKALPIEVHARLDLAAGLTAIAAPFVLGYAKKDPIAAMIHVGLGLANVVTSLVTDYRAARGVTWPTRSRGGPDPGPRRGKRGIRVAEVQRPLEGLSSAPSVWDPHASVVPD